MLRCCRFTSMNSTRWVRSSAAIMRGELSNKGCASLVIVRMLVKGGGVVAGVVAEDFVAQAGAVDVDVDFGGGNVLVAEHLLNGAQVSTTLEQMCGKTVAQCVRADDLADSGQLAQLLDNVENHLSGEHRTTSVQEQNVLAASLNDLMGSCLFHVQTNLLDGYG